MESRLENNNPFPLAELPDDAIREIVAKLFVTHPVAIFKLYLACIPSKAGSYCHRNADHAGRIERIIRPFLSPLALTRCSIITREVEFASAFQNIGTDIPKLTSLYKVGLPAREDRVSLPHLKFLAKKTGSSVLSDCYKLLTNCDFELTVDYKTLTTPHAIAWVNKGLVDFSRLNIQMHGFIEIMLNDFNALQSRYTQTDAKDALQAALVRTGLMWMERTFSIGDIESAEDLYKLWFNHPCFKRQPSELSPLARYGSHFLGFFKAHAPRDSSELSSAQIMLRDGYTPMLEKAKEKEEENQSYSHSMGFSG